MIDLFVNKGVVEIDGLPEAEKGCEPEEKGQDEEVTSNAKTTEPR